MRPPILIALVAALSATGTAHTGTAQEAFPLPRAAFEAAPPTHRPTRVSPHTMVRRTITVAEQLFIEREMELARQRTRRIEARKWLGVSTARPTDTTGFGTTNLYQYREPAGYLHPRPLGP
jgi:hypothetical protein